MRTEGSAEFGMTCEEWGYLSEAGFEAAFKLASRGIR